ncbi:MAG: thermonuclease family protein, partial [Spirochaetes bacterium]|nr:thermonuclease family protein [Spirochaetota bacterium]
MLLKQFILIPIYSLLLSINAQLSGKVISVSDGDTFTILHEKEQIKVRLYGIDCPEKSQAFGQKAKLFTSKKIFGKEITVISHGKDRYGRVLGEVVLQNGTTLNKELVKNGFAWWYRQYAPKNDTLRILEDSARIARVGLWGDLNPVEPWN